MKPYKFTHNSTAQTGNTTVWHWRFQLPKRSYRHLCHDGLSFGNTAILPVLPVIWVLKGNTKIFIYRLGLNFKLKPYMCTHNSTAQAFKLKPYKFTHNSTAQTGNTTVWHWWFQLPKRSYCHLCRNGLPFGKTSILPVLPVIRVLNGDKKIFKG